MTFLVQQKYNWKNTGKKRSLDKNKSQKSRSSIEDLQKSIIKPYENDLRAESLERLGKTSYHIQSDN